jgi:hypothetical protein
MSTEGEQSWSIPPEGSPCWIEIPARDLEKLKARLAPPHILPDTSDTDFIITELLLHPVPIMGIQALYSH